ncbi:MAG TPA: MFS transporter [Stellaceae bacterium]|nr:MFS transporter [Stellaceae bacterium]
MATEIIDVTALIEQRKLGTLHIRILILGLLAMVVDGFDLQVLGFAAPAATRALALAPGALGAAFAATGFGTLLGNLAFAPLSDRIGRKSVLLACLAFFGICSLATAAATSLSALVWLRFLTGLGLGGLMPTMCALVAEYTPRRLRVTFLGLIWLGFGIGAGSGGAITALVLQHYAWQGVFVFGSLLPFVLIPLMAWLLPESLQSLVNRNASREKLTRLTVRLKLISPDTAPAAFVTSETKEKGAPVALLFRDGRARLTILLWIAFFSCLMTNYFLSSWLPTIVSNAGVSEGTAITISGLLHLGAFANSLVILPFCERFKICFQFLVVAFFVGALGTAAIGLAGSDPVTVTIAIIAAGLFVFGAQSMLNAIAASVYPTAMRSTGSGWALGIGRIGQIIGPWIGGYLLSLHWSGNHILYVAGLSPIIGGIAALMLLSPGRRLQPSLSTT